MQPPTPHRSLILLVVLAAACGRPSPAPAMLTLDQLANAAFDSPAPAEGTIRLADGVYQEAAAPGAASAVSVRLLQDLAAFGDLDGDNLSDAAVILAGSGGGTGTFITLAAVRNEDGAPGRAATAYLGDRVRVSSVAIDSGEIVVTLTEHAPTDPLCCPRLVTERRFRLEEGTLTEISSTSEGLVPPIYPVRWTVLESCDIASCPPRQGCTFDTTASMAEPSPRHPRRSL